MRKIWPNLKLLCFLLSLCDIYWCSWPSQSQIINFAPNTLKSQFKTPYGSCHKSKIQKCHVNRWHSNRSLLWIVVDCNLFKNGVVILQHLSSSYKAFYKACHSLCFAERNNFYKKSKVIWHARILTTHETRQMIIQN